jgi:selenide, water dikinase
LHRLSFVPDANLLAGVGDDAAVYKLREDLAIVVSVDYFTPIVKEAYLYGQIAAANALSDIYAMGAKPIIALNIVCFPSASMDLLTLEEVLKGSSDKLKEAGVVLVGGHTVIDPKEIKYGLSVTGIVDPKKMLTKGGLQAGDNLILTKALGTGIINNALKGGMVDDYTQSLVAKSMASLNKVASEVALEAGVHACTDVTGFGLVGHLLEMVRESEDVCVEVNFSSLPIFPRVIEFAENGLIPPGSQRNRGFYQEKVSFSADIPEWKQWIAFDAQTSGGLLLSVSEEEAGLLLERLHAKGVEESVVIGRVVAGAKRRIKLS